MIRLVIAGLILISPLAHAAFSKAEAQQLVDNLLRNKNRLCSKDSWSAESIRSGAGKYCISNPGAALAFYICKDFTDPDGKQFLNTDCGKKLKPSSYTGSMLDNIAKQDGAALCDLVSKFGISAQACSTLLCPKKIDLAQLKLLEPRKTVSIGKYKFLLVDPTMVPSGAQEAQYVGHENGACSYLSLDAKKNFILNRTFQIRMVP